MKTRGNWAWKTLQQVVEMRDAVTKEDIKEGLQELGLKAQELAKNPDMFYSEAA